MHESLHNRFTAPWAPPDGMHVNVRQIVLTLSRAIELVGVDDVLHGRRVAIMATECAKALGWDEIARRLVFDAGLLHDCGVSSTRERRRIIDEFDWEGVQAHCQRGCELLHDFAPLAHLAFIVLNHHTHWQQL